MASRVWSDSLNRFYSFLNQLFSSLCFYEKQKCFWNKHQLPLFYICLFLHIFCSQCEWIFFGQHHIKTAFSIQAAKERVTKSHIYSIFTCLIRVILESSLQNTFANVTKARRYTAPIWRNMFQFIEFVAQKFNLIKRTDKQWWYHIVLYTYIYFLEWHRHMI